MVHCNKKVDESVVTAIAGPIMEIIRRHYSGHIRIAHLDPISILEPSYDLVIDQDFIIVSRFTLKSYRIMRQPMAKLFNTNDPDLLCDIEQFVIDIERDCKILENCASETRDNILKSVSKVSKKFFEIMRW